MVPSSMGKKITDAPIINAKGWGTIKSYDENPAAGNVIQSMTITFDSNTTIKQIVLKNNATIPAPGVSIKKNGIVVGLEKVEIEGSGYEKNIRVTPLSPFQIGPEDVEIKVYNAPLAIGKGSNRSYPAQYVLKIAGNHIAAGSSIHYSVDVAGPVSMELIGTNGAKIHTLMSGNVPAGQHSFVWNGRFGKGGKAGCGLAVLRLRSSAGVTSKVVFVEKYLPR